MGNSAEKGRGSMAHAGKTGNSGNRGRLATLALVLVLLIGLALLFYPSVSNWWNLRASTHAVLSYDEAVSGLTIMDYAAYREKAYAYNEWLASIGSADAFSSTDEDEGYWDILDITGTGIMGYVSIQKINVELPIYHGTSTGVLASGAGHLQGSSFPVGGESTHSVISAHRGLPSALLFTRLDELEVGDTFTVTVLDQVLTYEVDQISIALPKEMEYLYIEDGKDYITLLTCTPYGINTERLLVRGKRAGTGKGSRVRVTSEAYKVNQLLVAAAVAVPILLLLLLLLLVSTGTGGKKHPEETSGRKEND